MSDLVIKNGNDEKILCPHCGEDLEQLIEKEFKTGAFGAKKIYACAKCRKVVPVSTTN